MAESFYAENLTNKELRAKCLEYGLPNVPVTESSRSVMLRKLEKVMSTTAPKTTTQIPSNRRATNMHVSTPTQHVDAAITQQRSPLNRAKPSTMKQSPLVLPPSNRPYISLSKGGLTKTSFGQEAGEGGYSPHPVRVERVSETDSDSESIPRSNRSVSLSRSEVVTTSYVQETVPIKSYVTDAAEKSERYRPSQPQLYVQETVPIKSYVTDAAEKSERYRPSQPQLYVQETVPIKSYVTDAAEKSERYRPSQPQLYVQETVPIKSYVTDAAEKSERYRPSQPQPQLYPNLFHVADLNNIAQPLESHINKAAHFDAKLNRFVPEDHHIMPRSRFTTSATDRSFPTLEEFRPLGVNLSKSHGARRRTEQPRAPIQRSEYKDESDDYEDDVSDIEMVNLSSDNTDGEMSSEGSTGGAFYTSKFARNLERKNQVESKSSASSPIVTPRPPIGAQKGDVALRDIMTALERKYHLKQSFALILCFLLSVFVYIFFLQ